MSSSTFPNSHAYMSPSLATTRSWRQMVVERQAVEYTPANSIYEQGRRRFTGTEATAKALRFANGFIHLALVTVLLAIMATYLMASKEIPQRPLPVQDTSLFADADLEYFRPTMGILYYDKQCRSIAMVIVALTTIDAVIDLLHSFLLWLQWSAVALMARLLLGMGYLSIFMAQVALRKVFPPGYTYWGLLDEYSGPVVYLFLWVLGVWDMVHVCIHRYQIGTDTRKWHNKYSQWREAQQLPLEGFTAATARDGTVRTPSLQVVQADLESGRDMNPISTIQVPSRTGNVENKPLGSRVAIQPSPPTNDKRLSSEIQQTTRQVEYR